jgi:hypothetical protein
VPLEVSLPPGTIPRYPHMEWAFANGYSKKYTSSGWASYDSQFFRWAERQGYGVDLASQHELHNNPGILNDYDCVVFVGHDEYWTWEMRDAVDAYVEQGGHVARFAGNFMWQTRLEDEGQRQVCYKYVARAEDPAYHGGDVTRATNSWEAPEIGRPGALTFGLNATAASIPAGAAARRAACAVSRSTGREHWAFAGTGLFYGDLLGADSHIYGYEVDGLAYEIRYGLPYPTADSGAPEGLEILAVGMASQVEESRYFDARRPVLHRRGRPLHCRDAVWRGERRQHGKGPLQQRHDRQFQARQGRGFPRRNLRMGGWPAAQDQWSSASPPTFSTAISENR